MAGYTKLFSEILTSSIWMESNATRILWITMLAMADQNGEVMAAVSGLAHMANITRDECQEGLKVLMQPDPDSRTKDNDGRRIDEIDGGWIVLNHHIYRAKTTTDPKAAAARLRMRKMREKRESVTLHDVTQESVTSCNAVSVYASVDVDVSKKEKKGTGKTYKQWNEDEFLADCNRVHESEHILPSDEDGNRFFLYWTEPDASGRMKFTKQKTWDTKRRMITWRDNQERFGRVK